MAGFLALLSRVFQLFCLFSREQAEFFNFSACSPTNKQSFSTSLLVLPRTSRVFQLLCLFSHEQAEFFNFSACPPVASSIFTIEKGLFELYSTRYAPSIGRSKEDFGSNEEKLLYSAR